MCARFHRWNWWAVLWLSQKPQFGSEEVALESLPLDERAKDRAFVKLVTKAIDSGKVGRGAAPSKRGKVGCQMPAWCAVGCLHTCLVGVWQQVWSDPLTPKDPKHPDAQPKLPEVCASHILSIAQHRQKHRAIVCLTHTGA